LIGLKSGLRSSLDKDIKIVYNGVLLNIKYLDKSIINAGEGQNLLKHSALVLEKIGAEKLSLEERVRARR
jgi:hypothetical protein